MSKPREWWIRPELNNCYIQDAPLESWENYSKSDGVLVIEKSAYDVLAAELEHFKRQYADERSGDCDIPAVKQARLDAAEMEKLRAAYDARAAEMDFVKTDYLSLKNHLTAVWESSIKNDKDREENFARVVKEIDELRAANAELVEALTAITLIVAKDPTSEELEAVLLCEKALAKHGGKK